MSGWGDAADDLLRLASMRQKRDSTSLLSAAELDPSHVMEVGTGFWRSKTLLSAVELDLFSVLGAESMSGEDVGARLALHPWITNIQVSWVKLGAQGVAAALRAGVNDLGGTLMNESISRSAGAEHGQEFAPESMEELIRSAGRIPRQRTTLYGDAPEERRLASYGAAPLAESWNPPVKDARLVAPPRLVRPGFAA